MAVIAAGEFDDLISTSEAACKADGAHRRFRARTDHAHHFDGRHRFANQFRKFGFALARGPITTAAVDRLNRRFDNSGMTMAQNQWTPRADVIEVLVAVDVVKIGALAAGNKWRLTTDSAKSAGGAVHAAGNELVRSFKRRAAVGAVDGRR